MGTEVEFNATAKIVQPVLSTTVYSVGDAIGPIQSLPVLDDNNGTAILTSLSLVDTLAKNPGIDVLFYSQVPGGTITDNAALSITASDHAKYFLGRISIAATDYASQTVASNVSDVTKLAGSCGLKLASTDGSINVQMVLLCTAAPSGAYAAGAGNLTIRPGVDSD